MHINVFNDGLILLSAVPVRYVLIFLCFVDKNITYYCTIPYAGESQQKCTFTWRACLCIFNDYNPIQSNPMSITEAGQGLYFRLFLKFKIQKHK